jgi:capsular exopolysaccharide synthesis family protein
MTTVKTPIETSGPIWYLLAIRRRARLVVATIGLSLALALLALVVIPPKYTSSVGILIDPKGPGLLRSEGGDFSSRPVDSIKVGSVVAVIQSNDVLERVVKSLNLLNDPEFQPSRGLFSRLFGGAANETPSELSSAIAIEKLRKGINVFRDPFTYLIRVDYMSGSPEKAQRITQAIADAYLSDKVDARVISPPMPPLERSSPKRSVLLVVGGGLGLIAAFALVFLLERLDRTIVTPREIEASLNIPVLASVPLMEPRRVNGEWTLSEGLAHVTDNPRSRYSNALRTVFAGLNREASRRGRVVQFTSPGAGEGKSTIAAGVAVSSALSGIRTILIDCDLRGYAASTMFRKGDLPGVSEVMLGRKSLGDVIVPTSLPTLAMIPAGADRSTLPDLINVRRFRQVVIEASRRADLVIIDCGAAELTPDAAVISQVVDETVVVVKWRESEREAAARTVQRIRRAGGRPAGVVLNAVDLREATKYGCWSESFERDLDQYYGTAGQPGAPMGLLRPPVSRTYDRAKAFFQAFGGRNAG